MLVFAVKKSEEGSLYVRKYKSVKKFLSEEGSWCNPDNICTATSQDFKEGCYEYEIGGIMVVGEDRQEAEKLMMGVRKEYMEGK